MLKTAAVALATLTALASVAAADTESAHRSPDAAIAMSFGGALAGGAMLYAGLSSERSDATIAGLVLVTTGPAFGHYYAGDYWTTGTALRLAGMGSVTLGLGMAVADALGSESGGGDASGSAGSAAVLVIGGAALVLGGTAHDLATAGDAARDFNKHQLQIAPAPMRDSAGNTTPGFAVAGRF